MISSLKIEHGWEKWKEILSHGKSQKLNIDMHEHKESLNIVGFRVGAFTHDPQVNPHTSEIFVSKVNS